MDPDIAPLARRLAEENNVEWRRLQGSGSGGRIVERDVLDFLARVMAGEEDVNPTPEPLPDGVQAWTDEAGRPLGPVAPAGAYGDEPAHRDAADEDDLLLAGDDLLHESDTPEPDATEPDATEPDTPEPDATRAGASAAEEDLLLSGDEHAPSDAPARDDRLPDLFDERASESRRSGEAPDLFIDDDVGDEELGDRGAGGFDFGGFPGADAREPMDHEATSETDREPTFDAVGDDADALSFGDAEAGAVSTGGPYPVEADLDEPPAEEHVPSEPAPYEPEAPHAHERADIDATPTTAITAAVPSDAGVRAWPLARTRSVVRRHVDVGGLLSVRRSVALEAGMDDLAAVAVLYVAARRAADRLDVERPGIALPGGAGDVSVIVPEHEGLAEVGRAVQRAAREPEPHARTDADLWVVDLAGVDVDEVVLDTDVAQLVLGRRLSDDSDGSVRATLSLVADVPVERGAAFLARVADLLEEPLRLLA